MAVLGWLTLALQIFVVIRNGEQAGEPPIAAVATTLSYFTVLTNLLVAIVSTALALRRNGGSFLTRPSTVSATAVYIAIVGLVYSLVLRALWDPTGLRKVTDVGLHDVMPILFVLYWALFVPRGRIGWSQPLLWLIYPLAYIVYTIVRGAVTGWYPYPFADVNALGYGTALFNAALMLAAFYVLGLVVVAIDRMMARSRLARAT